MRCFSVVSVLVAMVVVGISGCGKIPTWSELTGEKKPTVEQAAPAAPAAPPVAAPEAAKGPSPIEVIAQFKTIKPGLMTDGAINNLTNLNEGLELVTEINADGSQVTKGAFGSIAKLTNLRQLRLNGTRVTDEACANIGKVTSLETLALSQTMVTDVGVAALTSLVNLKQLELANCHLTNNGFTAIGMLPKLETLVLIATNLDNRGMKEICRSETLISLYLNDNQIDDEGLSYLKKVKTLENLEIATTRISGAGLQYVNKKLKSLALNRCNLDGRSVGPISQFKSLERLNLGEIPLLNDVDLNKMLNGMKELKWLNLSRTKLFNGEGLKALKGCKQIEEVCIDQCPLVGDRPAVEIFKSLKSLKRIKLNGTAISPAGVQALKSENSSLEVY